MFAQPNPNNDAYNRETFNQSYRAHERFTQRHGPEVSPARGRPALQVVGQTTIGNATYYQFKPLANTHAI